MMDNLMKKEQGLVKKILPTTHIKGYQGNLYPKVSDFKYLGTNLKLNMHDPAVKTQLLAKLQKYTLRLLAFAKHAKTRLTFRAEQIYIWSVFRFYYLPIYACDIINKEEME